MSSFPVLTKKGQRYVAAAATTITTSTTIETTTTTNDSYTKRLSEYREWTGSDTLVVVLNISAKGTINFSF